MNKKWLIGGLICLIAIICVSFFAFNRQSSISTLSYETFPPQLIETTKTILYFSTTADQDMNRDGLSFAVFVDNKGDTDIYEMEGLELGTVLATNDTLFMEDRSNVFLINSAGLQIFPMETEEHTGEVTGFQDGRFYSVNNSGFTQDGGYSSRVRFGDEKGFDTMSIPYYLHMSGIADGELLMVTDEAEEISLQRMPLQKDIEIEKIVSLGPLGERLGLSPIMKESSMYYMIMSDTEKLTSEIYAVNEQTKSVTTIPFFTFKDAEDYRLRIPFNLRNASAIHDGILYYVDGLGEVHIYNTITKTVEPSFFIEGIDEASPYMAEQTFFKDGNLYIFRYDADMGDEKTRSHVIDTYDLTLQKRTNEITVEGIDSMYTYAKQKGKRISSYDFFVR